MLENEIGELLSVKEVAAELVVFTDKGEIPPTDGYFVEATQEEVDSAARTFRTHNYSNEPFLTPEFVRQATLKDTPLKELLLLAATEDRVLKHAGVTETELRAALAKGALEEIKQIGEAIVERRLGEIKTGHILSSRAAIIPSNAFGGRRRRISELESRKESLENFITRLTVYQLPSSPHPAASPMRK